jgi:hypothetical protein
MENTHYSNREIHILNSLGILEFRPFDTRVFLDMHAAYDSKINIYKSNVIGLEPGSKRHELVVSTIWKLERNLAELKSQFLTHVSIVNGGHTYYSNRPFVFQPI